VTSQEIRDGRFLALVGDMQHFDSGCGSQAFSDDVASRSAADRAKAQILRLLFREFDEIGKRSGPQIGSQAAQPWDPLNPPPVASKKPLIEDRLVHAVFAVVSPTTDMPTLQHWIVEKPVIVMLAGAISSVRHVARLAPPA
jgi:hypothetical protein